MCSVELEVYKDRFCGKVGLENPVCVSSLQKIHNLGCDVKVTENTWNLESI
jgi:hypothetical protein